MPIAMATNTWTQSCWYRLRGALFGMSCSWDVFVVISVRSCYESAFPLFVTCPTARIRHETYPSATFNGCRRHFSPLIEHLKAQALLYSENVIFRQRDSFACPLSKVDASACCRIFALLLEQHNRLFANHIDEIPRFARIVPLHHDHMRWVLFCSIWSRRLNSILGDSFRARDERNCTCWHGFGTGQRRRAFHRHRRRCRILRSRRINLGHLIIDGWRNDG